MTDGSTIHPGFPTTAAVLQPTAMHAAARVLPLQEHLQRTVTAADQPIAHTDGLWNFLGMALVGWGSVLLGGCPLRQVILAGEGNSDAAVTVTGFVVGAAICHNFGLAASAKGPTANGMIAVTAGFVILTLISLFNREKA